MDFNKKSIGIWGFGIVGKSAARYCANRGASLSIVDKRMLGENEQALVEQLHATHLMISEKEQIEEWISSQDYIIASPGVDVRPYSALQEKFIPEIDLFYQALQKPIIAVTGSVGKTTVTHLLSHLLSYRYPSLWTGGNIGTAMLDATHESSIDAALLELSSFQLEPCRFFAPDLAIWTNLYPNHLDRHGSMESYIAAKQKIIMHQTKGQQALLPVTLQSLAVATQATVHYFSVDEQPITLSGDSSSYFIRNDRIIKKSASGECSVVELSSLPSITFPENLLIITAALDIMGIPVTRISEQLANVALPAHRLELVATINRVSFYNDSKATTMAATHAAVEKLATNNRPIILMLGGMGKGIDRTPLIAQIKSKVHHIYCFGKEREELAAGCKKHGVPHTVCETIDEIIADYWPQAKTEDQLLLSPAGTGYDQFKNYEERGSYFKQCVERLLPLR